MAKRKSKPETRFNKNTDLPDSEADQQKLKKQEATIDMPDVKDIPGQEFVHVRGEGEFADTTISSTNEEGEGLWAGEEATGNDSSVSELEKKLLEDSANDMPTKDEQSLRRASLDNTDNEGEPLNEKSSSNAISGSDLDVPGAEQDDTNENIGEEDEENNPYSLGGDDNSPNEERSGT